jgi:hypothetical protein
VTYVVDFLREEDPGRPHYFVVSPSAEWATPIAAMALVGCSGGIGVGGIVVPVFILIMGLQPVAILLRAISQEDPLEAPL